MGMITMGEFHKHVDMSKLQSKQNSTWKHHDHNRQRQDYAAEITQPYDRYGKPNEEFIETFPDEAITYGFREPDELAEPEKDHGAQEVASNDELMQALIAEDEYYDD